MTTLYLFKNKCEIAAYAGEVLTMRVGDTITKTIKNPTEEQLKEFGYMELVETQRPEEKEGFAIEAYYEVVGDKIEERYEYVPLPKEAQAGE